MPDIDENFFPFPPPPPKKKRSQNVTMKPEGSL